MAEINLPDPILITTPKALHRLADQLSKEDIIAVDTESNSLYAYQEQVCLIQFSTRKQDYLVDPLRIADLSPLAPIFASPKIEKVFHAAEYDLMVMKRDYKFSFRNLFDTMVAGRILGWEAVGLGSIIKTYFGITADKRFQRADWGKRPLSRAMMAYARLDTHFLIPLRNMQRKLLKESGLLSLAEEDFKRACHVTITNGKKDINEIFWRVNGSRMLPPQKATVLRELCHYRDRLAKKLNRPLFKTINNKALYALAETCPTTQQELAQIKGLSKTLVRQHGHEILAVIKDGLRKEPSYPPHNRRPSESYINRLDNLRTWRKVKARKMKVGSDVILPRDLIYAIAEANPKTQKDLAEILQEVPWRLKHFGEEIMEVLQGRHKIIT